ncbi:MAG TPA: LuxR C-terminal-related transcriptional regulator [Terrimicrobiaceae bacterium]
MTLERAEAVNRASQLATVFCSLKTLGLADRSLFTEIMRRVLVANSGLLGVWTVWEPNALDGRDGAFAGTPGHDQSGRFVPFWHRYGGQIRLEANIDYDKPGADWYIAPARRKAEVLIDPYEYPVAGKNLFITSTAAPVFYAGRCAGVVGFDVHMDWLLEAAEEPGIFESIESTLGRGHILLGEDGQVRYCSQATRRLICRYIGGRAGSRSRLPEPLHDLVVRKLRTRFFSENLKLKSGWTFASGSRKLIVRFTRHPHAGCFLLLVDEQIEDGQPAGAAVDLSPREQEVAGWVSQGKSNEEIAIILGISAHTVKNHLDKIFRKLGVENRCAAAVAVQRRSAGMDC